MDTVLTVLLFVVTWRLLGQRYQRARMALLGRHLAGLQLERYMETLTQGYLRAIHEASEERQKQVLDTFTPTERSVATQIRSLADAVQKEGSQATWMSTLQFYLPFADRLLPSHVRDFRKLLHIHADGMRHVVDNEAGLDAKSRAFHLSAELYLFQHSCHWFCKSRGVADARLMLRHKLQYREVLDAVSDVTRDAYGRWVQGATGR